MKAHIYYVYIMASRPYGTLYTGVTNNVANRSAQHRAGEIPGFTKRYKVTRRQWKINLIERDNPHWEDLGPRLSM